MVDGKIHHIEIYVSQIERSKSFWTWLMEPYDYTIGEFKDGFSLFKGKETYLCFVQTQDKFLEKGYHRCNTGLNHLAFAMDSKEKIDDLRQRLIAKDVPLLYDDRYPEAGGKGYHAVFFEDPDRIKVEFTLKREIDNSNIRRILAKKYDEMSGPPLWRAFISTVVLGKKYLSVRWVNFIRFLAE